MSQGVVRVFVTGFYWGGFCIEYSNESAPGGSQRTQVASPPDANQHLDHQISHNEVNNLD